MRSRSKRQWVFNPFVDRLLHLERGDRVAFLEAARRAIDRYPVLAHVDRNAFVRGLAFNDAFNRLVFRAVTRFPALAFAAARMWPIVDPDNVLARAPRDRPLLLALPHFGPLHFAIAILMRAIDRKNVHIFHAGGDTGHATSAFFMRAGLIPYVSGSGTLKIVAEALAADPSAAIIVCYDYLGGRRPQTVPFLGGELAVSPGVSYFADRFDTPVVCARWEIRGIPRIRFYDSFAIDRTLEPSAAQSEFLHRLFASIGELVVATPSRWSEWPNADHVAVTGFASKNVRSIT